MNVELCVVFVTRECYSTAESGRLVSLEVRVTCVTILVCED